MLQAELETKSYGDIRNHIENGDLFFYRGNSWQSKIIKKGSGAYSHVGIAMWWTPQKGVEKRLMVVESVWRGVVISTSRRSIGKYDGKVEYWPLTPGARALIFSNPDAFYEEVFKHVGKSFSLRGIFSYMWRWFVDKPPMRWFYTPALVMDGVDSDDEKMFCSQYVSKVFRNMGADPARDRADRLTSPTDLSRSGLAVQHCEIEMTAADKRYPLPEAPRD